MAKNYIVTRDGQPPVVVSTKREVAAMISALKHGEGLTVETQEEGHDD